MNKPSPQRGWIGPLFWYELIRLLRRGQHTRLRIGLALLLLFVLFLVYAHWFKQYDPFQIAFSLDSMMSSRSMAEFAESFVLAFMMVQLAVVVIITPIYVGSSITEEIHRRTLEALFITDLTNSEIILGKLLARNFYVLGLLITGIPILVLTLLWGGVDGEILIVSYVIILSTSISIAGVSIYKAIGSGEIQTTLFQVFWFFLIFSILGLMIYRLSPFLGVLSPFVFLYQLFNSPSHDDLLLLGLVYFLIHMSAGMLFIWWSMRNFRKRNWHQEPQHEYRVFTIPKLPLNPPSPPEINPESFMPLKRLREEVEIHLPAMTSALLPPIRKPRIDEEDPLLWKERYVRTLSFWEKNEAAMSCLAAAGIFFAGLLLLMVIFSLLAVLSGDSKGLRDFYNGLIRYVGFLFLCGWIIVTGLNAVTSVTKERDRDTLISLFLIPVDRNEILWAKWYGCWSRGKIIPYFLIAFLVIGVFFGGTCAAYAPLAFGYCIALVALSISLGLLLSVRSRNGFRATMVFFLIWIGILSFPYFLGETFSALLRSYGAHWTTEDAVHQFCRGLSPVQVWQTLNLPLYPPAHRGEEQVPDRVLIPWVWGAVGSTFLVMVLAWIFWKCAGWRFEREGRR